MGNRSKFKGIGKSGGRCGRHEMDVLSDNLRFGNRAARRAARAKFRRHFRSVNGRNHSPAYNHATWF